MIKTKSFPYAIAPTLFAMLLVLCAAVWVAGCVPPSPAEEAEPITAIADETKADETVTGASLEYPEWQTVSPGEHLAYNQRTNLVQRGHLVYRKYCVGCHGEYGDGNGPATARLITRPRDFTSGIYKFRSTDSGSLPLDEDLHRTITRGLSQVSMPAFRLMPEADKLAVIEYIKDFYPRWDQQKADRRLIHIPSPPEDLRGNRRVLRGRVVYLQMQCWKCHGTDGRGSGATQTDYVDAWGDPQKPFDFTRGGLKGGNAPEDIYRTFQTGLRSIMPAYEGEALAAVTSEAFDTMQEAFDTMRDKGELESVRADFPADGDAIFSAMSLSERLDLAERNSWDLVAYILSLRTETHTAAAVLGPRPVLEQTP